MNLELSELQLGLIGLGAAGVVLVIAYNVWQERRHRRIAERALGPGGADALVGEAPVEPQRIEPTLDGGFDDVNGDAATEVPVLALPANVDDAADAPRPAAGEMGEFTEADARIEASVALDTERPMQAHALWQAWRDAVGDLDANLRGWGWDDQAGRWLPLGPNTVGTVRSARFALQLADRRGPVSAATLAGLAEGVQRLADRIMAVVQMPDTTQVLREAGELDAFAASVDGQISLNIVSAGTPFSGTKLRGLAQAQGLELAGDGLFHARDDAGLSQFTLGNLEPALFDAEGLRTLSTSGLILLLDIPVVASGSAAFDRMLACAQQLSAALGGTLVDDNRVVLSAASLEAIRGTIANFQSRMQQYGVQPGSETARRLFS